MLVYTTNSVLNIALCHMVLLTDGCWHQFSDNRNPQFAVQWRKKLFKVQTAKVWYSMALLWNSSIISQLNYEAAQHGIEVALGPGLPLAGGLADIFCVSPPSGETESSVFGRKGKCTLWVIGELLYIERCPHPRSLISLCSCEWGLQILKVWFVQKVLSWLVSEDTDGDIPVQL